MKPLGPTPAGYASVKGELSISGKTVSEIISITGRTPSFVYSKEHIASRVSDFRAAMPKRLGLNYAVKANPFGPLIDYMKNLVDGFDIASAGELTIVQTAGIDSSRVSFAGPGKRDEEIERALLEGVTLNCESEGEVRRAIALGDSMGIAPKIAIRVNPSFEIKGSGMKMGGGPKPFGVDETLVVALAREVIASGCEWKGLHIFTGSQSLQTSSIIEAQAKLIDCAYKIADQIGSTLPKLNMGGGFGIPYFNGDNSIDLLSIGKALGEVFEKLPKVLTNTDICMELGRFLVGEGGVYLTRIVDRKTSYGVTYLITDGGLHHQLGASGNFGTVVRRNYPVAIASQFDGDREEVVNIVGCLCTPLDRLADEAYLPKADVGDLVAVFCAGAYGLTASPSNFLGHGPAAEVLI